MSDKYRNRYRISTARAPWWDYGNGSYFVTLCTRNRVHFFGEIKDCVLEKTLTGEIAEKYWKEIPDKFPYASLGQFIIMPNHIHGILTIRRPFKGIFYEKIKAEDKKNANPEIDSIIEDISDVELVVETRLIASLQPIQPVDDHSISPPKNRGGVTGEHNPMLHQNLSRVLRWYTGRVSFEVHKIDPDFNWQRRFHDEIIQDLKEYRIKTWYIRRNPANWKNDQFY